MKKSCKNCLITDDVEGVTIGKDSLCDYCTGKKEDEWITRHGVTEERRKQLRKKLDEIVDKERGKSEYDCVLLLSGGKDSAYLAYNLLAQRKLKVLAVHVPTIFETPLAGENVNRLKQRLQLDLKIVHLGDDFFIKFYRAILQHASTKESYRKALCGHCGPVLYGCAFKVATEKRIPLVFSGVSPNQPQYPYFGEHLFFELDLEKIKGRDHIPNIFKSDEFDDGFRNVFWNPLRYPEGTIFPKLLMPLHVMEYNDNEIMNFLSRNGILPRGKSHPARTNCDLNTVMAYLDMKNSKPNPFLEEFSAKVRKGEVSRGFVRGMKLFHFFACNLGIYSRSSKIRNVEKKLSMKLSDLLSEGVSTSKN